MSALERPSSGSRRFDALAGALSMAVLTAGPDGHVDFANPAARELFWRTEHDLLGTGWLTTVDPEDLDRVHAATQALRRVGDVADVEFRLDVAGHLRWVRGRLSAIDHGAGLRSLDDRDRDRDQVRDCEWVGSFVDVTSERANADDLAYRADHDDLTGLPTRNLLHDRIEQALARSQRTDDPIAVLFLDLDRFKPVNDEHGHATGDAVLQEVAERLRHQVRGSDTVARLGGDEFVVVAEGIDREIAGLVAHRLVEAIDHPIFLDATTTVSVSASIGVAWGRPGSLSAATIISHADQAMYDAKGAGVAVAFADLFEPMVETR